MSGKGGSGKTTLALSMATMLSSCGIKVLLVDCDLSTNGATYFYEERLATQKKSITSFHEILFQESCKKLTAIEINPYYDFVPSITQISKKSAKTYNHKSDTSFPAFEQLRQKYDVILFDCQAGYADILKILLPITDVNLLVMETDAVSSAAIRSLYLKIGGIINDKKMYQVFNKASQEEYETYSKVSGGTFFTNIETIRFDWKIRKAFSVLQVPDMENTSAQYGEQMYSICSILFTNQYMQEKLKKYKLILDLHTNEERKENIQTEINKLTNQARNIKNGKNMSLFMLATVSVTLTCLLTFITLKDDIFWGEHLSNLNLSTLMVLLSVVSATIATLLMTLDSTKERRNLYKVISDYDEELKKTERISAKLEAELSERKNSED